MKTKPFDGVKMGKLKKAEYTVGKKKLSKKLKNIKMFEEFSADSIEEGKSIDQWDDATVDKMYGYYLDELSNDKREAEEAKDLSTEEKREVLKNQESSFKKQF